MEERDANRPDPEAMRSRVEEIRAMGIEGPGATEAAKGLEEVVGRIDEFLHDGVVPE